MAQTVMAAATQPQQTDKATNEQPTQQGKVLPFSIAKGKGAAHEPQDDELTAVLDLFFM